MTVAKAKGKALTIVLKIYRTGFTYNVTYDRRNNFIVQATDEIRVFYFDKLFNLCI
jgi:hypothetical protein